MTIEALRQTTARLNTAATALAALGAAIEDRLGRAALDPALAPHVDEVLVCLGLHDAFEGVSADELAGVLGEVRTLMAVGPHLLDKAVKKGWAPYDALIMQAAGEATAGFPRTLATAIAPKLGDLSLRLASPEAAFLDVGVGVAALSIQMARIWPSLRVVGIDVWAPALALARENVVRAGLEARIELREGPGERIAETNAFDLAWIPTLFVPGAILPELLRRVHRALRVGGWLLLPVLKPTSAPLTSAVARLRTAFWGGTTAEADEVRSWLASAGFVDVRSLPSNNPGASTMMLAASRQR